MFYFFVVLLVTLLTACGGGELIDREESKARTTADTSAPTLTITTQTQVSPSGIISISGKAGDNKGVKSVRWSNNLGGSGLAVLSGKTTSVSWTASNVQLLNGNNIITITAEDTSANKTSISITVAYVSSDTTPPNITYSTQTSYSLTTVTLSGSATDNIGVVLVNWNNNTLSTSAIPVSGSATLSGISTAVTWTAVITVASGTNLVTLTARDAGGNFKSIQVNVTVTSTGNTSFDNNVPYGQPRMPDSGFFRRYDVEEELKGKDATDSIKLKIIEPPAELHPCTGGLVVFNDRIIPQFPSEEFLYKNWWLLASYTPVTENALSSPRNKKDKVYFYWAWRLNKTQLGVVYTGTETNAVIDGTKILDIKIDTGFTNLPFHWRSNLWLAGMPYYKDELCN